MAEDAPDLSPDEQREVEERSPPRSRVVHAAVSKQADDELDRPVASLFWSGLAAGIAMVSSIWAQGALHQRLPDAPWRELVAGFGYCLGFMIVILGRMQLFTEHTMVAVLPLAAEPNARNLRRTARLWSIVFAGNVIGAAFMSALCVYARIVSPGLLGAMTEVSSKLLEKSAGGMLLQAIPAGFLIGSVAWIRSASDDSSFWIVIALTYPIAICGFTHVIAGSGEAFLLLWTGKASLAWVVGTFLIPALVGNIIGGTGIFAMLAHAQVKEEI